MTQTADRIVITATKYPVSLVEKDYLVYPPSAALALRLQDTAAAAGEDVAKLLPIIESLVMAMFGATQGKAVMKRINDDQDPLDYVHVMALVEALTEKVSGNPTS